jgi:RimJ/RimL family protein N-acetyltransferase
VSTARLRLRPFAPEDLDDVWAYQRQAAVVRHTIGEARDRRQSQESVDQMVRETGLAKEGDCLSLAVVWPALDKVIGQVELVWRSEESRQGELGYMFNPEYHGRGLATEAVLVLLRFGFEELGLHRIIGRCSGRNDASARLLERLGMRREAHFVGAAFVKGEWRDELVYAMLRHEWTARSDAPGDRR